MDSLLRADIFFFITSIAVVMLTVVFAVAMAYLIRILRDVRHISQRLREETDVIIEDIEELRKRLKKQGERTTRMGQFLSMVLGRIMEKRKRSQRNAKNKKQ